MDMKRSIGRTECISSIKEEKLAILKKYFLPMPLKTKDEKKLLAYPDWVLEEADLFKFKAVADFLEKEVDDVYRFCINETVIFHYPIERFVMVWNNMKERYGERFWKKFLTEGDGVFTKQFLEVDVTSSVKAVLMGTLQAERDNYCSKFERGNTHDCINNSGCTS